MHLNFPMLCFCQYLRKKPVPADSYFLWTTNALSHHPSTINSEFYFPTNVHGPYPRWCGFVELEKHQIYLLWFSALSLPCRYFLKFVTTWISLHRLFSFLLVVSGFVNQAIHKILLERYGCMSKVSWMDSTINKFYCSWQFNLKISLR